MAAPHRAPATDPGLVEATRLYTAIGRLVRQLRQDGVTDLGAGSFSALVSVVDHGPIRLGDLARRESVAKPTLSRIVVGLVDNGYLERQADPLDGRAVLVAASESGRRLVAAALAARAAVLRDRLSQLSAADHDRVVAALPALEALVV
jgi:DNA-binding MarR family transcriptional regulator